MIGRWLLLGLVCWAACGGGGKAVDPGVDPPDPPDTGDARPGRVRLDNQLPYEVEVAYLNRVDDDVPRVVRTSVDAGARQDVSGEMLPAAMEVEFDLVVLVPPQEGFRLRRKALAQIDGDVLVQLLLAAGAELTDLKIEMGPLD